MKTGKNLVNTLIAFSIMLFIIFYGCNPDITPSLYDNSGEIGVPAKIVSVSPESGYAGVTKVTIDGEHFASKPEDNYVFFGPTEAEVLSATETQLVVKAPVVFGDSLLLKIAKPKVEDFSNTVVYKLSNAVNNFYPFLPNQEPHTITSDGNGTVYFSLVESNVGQGVWKIKGDSLSKFAPKKSNGEAFYNDLKYHSDGYLLGVALLYKYAIFQITENQVPKVWATAPDKTLKFLALDIDKDKNVWAAGKGGKIVSFTPDKSAKLFEYEPPIVALRVFNDYLYAISGEENSQKIVRFQIYSADSLGTEETYFDFSTQVGAGILANSITIDADGQMYIATGSLEDKNYSDPIIYVKSDGTFGTWYAGLIGSSISDFTWGTGTNIFAVQNKNANNQQLILKIDMERLGAPEFGRD